MVELLLLLPVLPLLLPKQGSLTTDEVEEEDSFLFLPTDGGVAPTLGGVITISLLDPLIVPRAVSGVVEPLLVVPGDPVQSC